MAARTHSAARPPQRTALPAAPDAITLLKQDHQRIDALFRHFEQLERDGAEKAALVQMICAELRIHTQVEEAIFYPAVHAATGDDALTNEADVEHALARALVEELESMKPGDDHYDAMVTVLGRYVRQHMEKERQEIFPRARAAHIDLEKLGAVIAACKRELLGQHDAASEPAPRETSGPRMLS